MSSYIADEEFEFLKIERTNGVVFVTIDAPPTVSYTHLTLPTIYSV